MALNRELEEVLTELELLLPWEDRTRIMGARFGAMTMEIVQAAGLDNAESSQRAMGLMLLTVMHTAYRHPEWLMAVCEESKELVNSPLAESGMRDIINFWPIAPREDTGGIAE